MNEHSDCIMRHEVDLIIEKKADKIKNLIKGYEEDPILLKFDAFHSLAYKHVAIGLRQALDILEEDY